MNIITYEWNGKKFTNGDRLNTLFCNGIINRDVTRKNQYGAWYKFSTKGGDEIATIYKDDTFGFGSQACETELTNVKLL